MYFNPHIQVYIRAKSEEVPGGGRVPDDQELRGKIDLGSYTLDELADLRTSVLEAIEEWVSDHPPHGG